MPKRGSRKTAVVRTIAESARKTARLDRRGKGLDWVSSANFQNCSVSIDRPRVVGLRESRKYQIIVGPRPACSERKRAAVIRIKTSANRRVHGGDTPVWQALD